MSEFSVTAEAKGVYTLKSRDIRDNSVKHIGVVNNLLTNFGLAAFGQQSIFVILCLGSDNTEPLPTDEQLGNELYQTGYTDAELSHNPDGPFGFCALRCIIPAGSVTGFIREIGCKSSNGYLASRALLTNDDGDPIEIQPGPFDELEITYQLRCYPSLGDTVSYVTTKGVEYEVVMRCAGVASSANWIPSMPPPNNYIYAYNGPIGTEYQMPSGAGTDMSVGIYHGDHDPGGVDEEGATFGFWNVKVPLTHGNLSGGIRSIVLMTHGRGAYQMQFTPPLPKTSRDLLDFKVKFRVKGVV